MNMSPRFRQWAQKYKSEGRAEGEAALLQMFLTGRFGPLPAQVCARIDAASVEQIESWADRMLLGADSLDDVFRA